MTRRALVALGLFALAAGGIGLWAAPRVADGGRAWTASDPWHTRAPAAGSEPLGDGWEKVPDADIFEVVNGQVADAAARLERAGAVEVTGAEAATLTGGAFRARPDARAVLVRGLCLNRATGGFTVRRAGDRLSVHHGSLGRRAAPMARLPLVLRLPVIPATVYVTVSMAE